MMKKVRSGRQAGRAQAFAAALVLATLDTSSMATSSATSKPACLGATPCAHGHSPLRACLVALRGGGRLGNGVSHDAGTASPIAASGETNSAPTGQSWGAMMELRGAAEMAGKLGAPAEDGAGRRSGRKTSDALMALRRMRKQMEDEEQLRSVTQQLKSKAQEKMDLLMQALTTGQSLDAVIAGRRGDREDLMATDDSDGRSGGMGDSSGRKRDAVSKKYLSMGSLMGSTWEDPEELVRDLEGRLASLDRENANAKNRILSLRRVSHVSFAGGTGKDKGSAPDRAGGDWLILEGDNPWVRLPVY